MSNRIQLLKKNWKEATAQENFVWKFAFQFSSYLIIFLLLSRFLVYNRFREGTVLHDPIMLFFHTVDFSAPVFFFTYSGTIAFIYYILLYPRTILPMARAFLALFALRVCFIYLVPLQPPADMIPLTDPFIDKVIGFNREVVNDLFFSGHIADLSLFAFCCRNKPIRYFLILGCVLVSVMLVWQKVHYTADVIAAPFFSYFCYSVLAKKQIEHCTMLPAR